MINIRKSVAGHPVPPTSSAPHDVTPLGSETVRRVWPMLELVTTHGKRYSLRTANSKLAKLYRMLFDTGNGDLMPLTPKGSVIGALGSDGEFQPVFKAGKLFGVTRAYIQAVTEDWESRRKVRTLDESVQTVCRDLGISRAQLFDTTKRNSPFIEYEEDDYGAQWYKCARVLKQVYQNKLAKLEAK